MKKRKKVKSPGKAYRRVLTILELAQMFSTEEKATRWFEEVRWGNIRFCGCYGSIATRKTNTGRPMPFWCRDCRSYFSIWTGTPMESSGLPLQKWAIAIYLRCTNLKGISSLKMHRIENMAYPRGPHGSSYIGSGKVWDCLKIKPVSMSRWGPMKPTWAGESNKHASKKLRKERGGVGKTAVFGIKTRITGQVYARTVESTDRETLHGLINKHVRKGHHIYTDEALAYKKLHGYRHKSVKHSAGQYVDDMAHTNGIESFWSMLKHGYHGTYHKMSPKHLDQNCNEFAGRHNIRELDTIEQMEEAVRAMNGRVLPYGKLVGKDL